MFSTSYTFVSPVTTGTTYSFKVSARNSVGYSDYSESVSILAAQVPDKPLAPSTSVVGPKQADFVKIEWLAPNNKGYQITSYLIKVRQSDGVTFSEEAVSCDGTDTAIISS